MKTVLFLCTGNYYRSRFAEEVFNHLVPANCPSWRAISRGIAVDLGVNNRGPIATSTVQELAVRRIPFDRPAARNPIQVSADELDAADRIVAVSETEHLPMLRQRFAKWVTPDNLSRVEFWAIDDIELVEPAVALPALFVEVIAFVKRLGAGLLVGDEHSY